MNYLLVSPNFPVMQEFFAKKLVEKGVKVLGIGSESYDNLSDSLKSSLSEYYKVDDLENYEDVLRGVAHLIYKHGIIDRVESNNEHWLMLDATIREEFNIKGVKPTELDFTKYKSRMKEKFKNAKVPVAEGVAVSNISELNTAIKNIKLPVIAKPDNGVGASNTYKLLSNTDVEEFKKQWNQDVVYFIESYVDNGILCTYDGLIDSKGEIVFETSFYYTKPTLDLLNGGLDYANVIEKKIDPKLQKYGRKIVKEFGMKERFFHIEFFKLPNGDYIALEYNNRIAGGYTIDLYNHTYECDLYDMYSKVVIGENIEKVNNNFFGIALSRRDKYSYKHSLESIKDKYNRNIRLIERVPGVFATAMGEWMFILVAEKSSELDEMMNYIHEKEE